MSAELFYNEMREYMDEYLELLRSKYSSQTVDKSYDVLFFFTDFIYHRERCNGFEDITVAMTNSKFMTFFIKNANKLLTEKECKSILKGFFLFIKDTYSIKNDKILNGLK